MKDYTITLPYAVKTSKSKKLSDYTIPELDRIRGLANFTEDELEYFNLRSKDKSNIYIAMSMNISDSKLYDIIRSVKSKIERIK